MAEGKFFKMFARYLPILKVMEADEVKEVMIAACTYAKSAEPQMLDSELGGAVFEMIRGDIDDENKFRAKMSACGKLGGRAKRVEK